jgi:DNA-directed RNA polymerase
MTYIIKIQDNSLKAKSIINMLKALKEDYDFIEIKKDNSVKPGLTLDKELDKRYKSFQKDNKGKEWEDLKSELKSK